MALPRDSFDARNVGRIPDSGIELHRGWSPKMQVTHAMEALGARILVCEANSKYLETCAWEEKSIPIGNAHQFSIRARRNECT